MRWRGLKVAEPAAACGAGLFFWVRVSVLVSMLLTLTAGPLLCIDKNRNGAHVLPDITEGEELVACSPAPPSEELEPLLVSGLVRLVLAFVSDSHIRSSLPVPRRVFSVERI